MSESTITSALAIPFAFATETWDFVIGSTTYTVTMTAGSAYRMLLGTSSTDFLRLVEGCMNACSPSLPGGVSFSVSIGAGGLVSITISSGTWRSTSLDSARTGLLLGIGSSVSSNAATHTGEVQPKYLVLCACAYDGVWKASTPIGAEQTAGGRVVAFRAGETSRSRTYRLELIPRTPEDCTAESSTATPWHPSEAYWSSLGDTATLRAWSWEDNLRVAHGALCGWTEDYQAARVSTSARYFCVYVGAETLSEPDVEPMDPSWTAYANARLTLVQPTTGGTATRA
jgi:hypothetical protein